MARFALSLTLLLFSAWLLFEAPTVRAQPAREEYELKAAFLFSFLQYVEWPEKSVAGDEATFFIGVLGPDPFGKHLKKLEERIAKDKKITIKHFATADKYVPCHMLFVSSKVTEAEGPEARLAAAREKTKGRPVLIVTDAVGQAEKGAVINIVIEKDFPKLEVNIDSEKRAGVKIDSRLLQLARIIRDAKEKP